MISYPAPPEISKGDVIEVLGVWCIDVFVDEILEEQLHRRLHVRARVLQLRWGHGRLDFLQELESLFSGDLRHVVPGVLIVLELWQEGRESTSEADFHHLRVHAVVAEHGFSISKYLASDHFDNLPFHESYHAFHNPNIGPVLRRNAAAEILSRDGSGNIERFVSVSGQYCFGYV